MSKSQGAAVELTPWFPEDVKPVRRGVYETEFSIRDGLPWAGYSMWTGRRWCNQRNSVGRAKAAARHGDDGAAQDKRWRGLTAPVEGIAK